MNKYILKMWKTYIRLIIIMILFILISVTLLYMSTSAVYRKDFPYSPKILTNSTQETLTRTASQFNLKQISQTKNNIDIMSKTKPRFYPFNGTGTTVDISDKYDTNAFNLFCNNDNSLVAILPVYSAPGNSERRRSIRETVGKDCVLLKCRIFFIVAISLNETINRNMKVEYDKERDILIVNKIDTYRDLNNKVVAMLDWIIEYCQEPKYVIHFIDDTYPNLKYFIDHLDTMHVNRFMIGHIAHRAQPFRSPDSKWYISKEEFPYPVYPDYIVGTAYAFLNKDCQVLRDHVHSVEYCWVEDVWFAGMVAKGANFTFVPFKRSYANNVPSITQYNWNSYAMIHNVSPDKFYDIFKRKMVNDNAI